MVSSDVNDMLAPFSTVQKGSDVDAWHASDAETIFIGAPLRRNGGKIMFESNEIMADPISWFLMVVEIIVACIPAVRCVDIAQHSPIKTISAYIRVSDK